MYPQKLPNCEQCGGQLALTGGEFACIRCGMPHPHVKHPEDMDHESEEVHDSVEPEPETVAHKKPGRKKK